MAEKHAGGKTIAGAVEGESISIAWEDMKENAEKKKKKTGLNLLPTVTRLAQAKTCLNNTLTL